MNPTVNYIDALDLLGDWLRCDAKPGIVSQPDTVVIFRKYLVALSPVANAMLLVVLLVILLSFRFRHKYAVAKNMLTSGCPKELLLWCNNDGPLQVVHRPHPPCQQETVRWSLLTPDGPYCMYGNLSCTRRKLGNDGTVDLHCLHSIASSHWTGQLEKAPNL